MKILIYLLVLDKYDEKNLKEIDIQILTLFYYEQRSTREISKMLDISEMNVRTKLYRLRNKIRKEMNY